MEIIGILSDFNLSVQFFPGIVLGLGTHVEEPVLANGMLELSTDFVKISRIAEQVLWNEDKVVFFVLFFF